MIEVSPFGQIPCKVRSTENICRWRCVALESISADQEIFRGA